MKIYCDMDGVLVDFNKGAMLICDHIFRRPIGQQWLAQSRSMRKAMRAIHKRHGADFCPQNTQELNDPAVQKLLMAAVGFGAGFFFAFLEPYSDGITELWPYLNSMGFPCILLSAPIHNKTYIRHIDAAAGKKLWAQHWLSPQPTDIIIGPAREKSLYAEHDGKPNLLIDDKRSTVDQWNAAGGIGILHKPGHSCLSIEKIGERFNG